MNNNPFSILTNRWTATATQTEVTGQQIDQEMNRLDRAIFQPTTVDIAIQASIDEEQRVLNAQFNSTAIQTEATGETTNEGTDQEQPKHEEPMEADDTILRLIHLAATGADPAPPPEENQRDREVRELRALLRRNEDANRQLRDDYNNLRANYRGVIRNNEELNARLERPMMGQQPPQGRGHPARDNILHLITNDPLFDNAIPYPENNCEEQRDWAMQHLDEALQSRDRRATRLEQEQSIRDERERQLSQIREDLYHMEGMLTWAQLDAEVDDGQGPLVHDYGQAAPQAADNNPQPEDEPRADDNPPDPEN
jgi:hypothetical protein